jgi:hypothetical protein
VTWSFGCSREKGAERGGSPRALGSVLGPGGVENCSNPGQELLAIEGLGEKEMGGQGRARSCARASWIARNEERAEPGKAIAQTKGQLLASEARHYDIGQQKIDLASVGLGELLGLDAISG